ncbi:MAG: winged helix-turn-helix domain-containing protein, partial [Thermoplasmata archaeon]
RGGPNRARILDTLAESPQNAHRLAESLSLDYRTVRHHLLLLENNGLVTRPVGDAYGSPYELSPHVALHFDVVEEVRRGRAMGRRPPITLTVGPSKRGST